jgi:hypothetical protein
MNAEKNVVVQRKSAVTDFSYDVEASIYLIHYQSGEFWL